MSEKERREELVSGLVYELWGTNPDRPESKLPDMLFQDPNWGYFEVEVVSKAGGLDKDAIAEVLHDLDDDIGEEIWWLIDEDDEEDEPPPESIALWMVGQL